jgi:hypothetical protein
MMRPPPGTDAIRHLHPTKPMFTFRDYKRNRWPRDASLRPHGARPAGASREINGNRRPSAVGTLRSLFGIRLILSEVPSENPIKRANLNEVVPGQITSCAFSL